MQKIRTLGFYTKGFLFILLRVLIILAALNQFYLVYQKKKLNTIEKSDYISFSFLNKSGKFTIGSRGVLFLIFAWFIYKAAPNKNAHNIKGTQEMFSYLHSLSFGNVLIAILALGFIS